MFNQTRHCLQTFDNQHEFERLAADMLNSLGYENVEPMAPLGGADGGTDIKYKNGVAEGVAFVTLRKDIHTKFFEDLNKQKNSVNEIALFSIVDITPNKKAEFASAAISKGATLEVFDIERIRSLFDSTLKDLRRRYLGIDDDMSIQIKDKLFKLIKFKNTQTVEISSKSFLEKKFINKLPQYIFSLLIGYEFNSVKEVPIIGKELEKYLYRYDSFYGDLIAKENLLLSKIGQYESCRFRESWVIHYKYSCMRFSGMTAKAIQEQGDFLNYSITWDSAESVFKKLLDDKSLDTLIKPIFDEYNELSKLCLELTNT